MARSLLQQTGRPPGMKRIHGVYAAVGAVVWFGILAVVLLHGRGDTSGVDVYSELPVTFTGDLQAQGVTYQGLSSVDGTTVNAVLASTGGAGVVASDSSALVLRTSFSTTRSLGSKKYTDQPALMVVVPNVPASAGSGSTSTSATSTFVEFVDPTTYQVFTHVTYTPSPGSVTPGAGGSPTG